MAVEGDPVPGGFDHPGKLLVGLETLPPEGGFPPVEEPPRPALPLIAPQLPEHLLEEIGLVQSPIGREELLQGLTPLLRQVGPMGQQRVFLALDEAAIFSRESGILALA